MKKDTRNENDSLLDAIPPALTHTFEGKHLGNETLRGLNEELKKMVMGHSITSDIKKKAREFGMRTLRDDGYERVRTGMTTLDEVIKVTQEDEDFG